ncbi:MAG: EamA family transporter [bacterium]
MSVGASMYPVFVIALAHLTLGERLHRLQGLGGVLALAGSALIVLG